MIIVKGFHGTVSPNLAEKVNTIAKVKTERYIWSFDGTIGEFANKWKDTFVSYYNDEDQTWSIYITDYNSFSAR